MDGGLVETFGEYSTMLLAFFHTWNSSHMESNHSNLSNGQIKLGMARFVAVTNELESLNIPYITSETVVAVLSVFGNALVIAAFCADRKLRIFRNYHIINLAVADFFVGLVGIPLAVMASLGLPRNLNGCILSVSTLLVLCTASILCLVAVSVDRFWAAINPIQYLRHMSSTIANGMIVTCWLLSIIIGGLPLFGWHNFIEWEARNECRFGQIISYSYLTFLYFGTTVLPAGLLLFFYGYVYYIIHDRFQIRSEALEARRSTLSATSGTTRKSFDNSEAANKKREARAAAKLGSIVIFFMICWMPLHTINCLKGFQVELEIPHWFMEFTIVLSHANSALNPILYGFYLKDFRQGMKKILLRIISKCGFMQSQKYEANVRSSRIISMSK